MESILIKNAVAVLPCGETKADIYIENGIITKIGENIDLKADRVIDAVGKYLLPGLVDMHTHLREPGFEYKEDIESGTRAAAAGGFTSILCMANTSPVNDDQSVTSHIIKRAKEVGSCKVYPVGAISKGLKGQELSNMDDLKAAGAVAFSDDGVGLVSGEVMTNALIYADMIGMPVLVHPEDLSITNGGVMHLGRASALLGLPGIPKSAEAVMIARDIMLAEETGCPVHFQHVSSAQALCAIRQAKQRGVKITCETAPQYLFLDDSACMGYNTMAKMSPPLREKPDQEALIEGLLDGTVDAIATDHAPHNYDTKHTQFMLATFGMTGLETSFAVCYTRLVHTGRMTLAQLVEKMSTAPAKIAKIEGGRLEEGAAADITMVDFEKITVDAAKHHSKGKNTPLHGRELFGRILLTIADGKITHELGN